MARAVKDPLAPTEAQFQDAVVELARRLGWKASYVPDFVWRVIFARMKSGRRAGVNWPDKGIPDLLLCHEERGRLVFIECKVPPNKATAEQRAWMRALKRVPFVEVYLVGPADWDLIAAILQSVERPTITEKPARKMPRKRLDKRTAEPHDSPSGSS